MTRIIDDLIDDNLQEGNEESVELMRQMQTATNTNHCVLAQATEVYPDAETSYVLVYLYEDLEGNVEITNVADFDFGALSEG